MIDEVARVAIERCHQRIELSSRVIDRIENHGMRFYSAEGSREMEDVTDSILEQNKQHIERDKDLIKLWSERS